MPTLAEILAAKRQKQPIEPIEAISPALPQEEILTPPPPESPLPIPSDIHHILAFIFHLDNPCHQTDYISLLSYLNIPYTPWITKAREEYPPPKIAFLVAQYYSKTMPVEVAFTTAAHILRGIGRLLNDAQLELLTREIERKLQDG